MTLFSTLILAQEAPPPTDTGFIQTMVMLAVAMLFFYIILYRPEQKRRKALEDQRSSLKKGDQVVASGIVGTVASADEETVTLKMVDGAKVKFLRAAIHEVIASDDGE